MKKTIKKILFPFFFIGIILGILSIFFPPLQALIVFPLLNAILSIIDWFQKTNILLYGLIGFYIIIGIIVLIIAWKILVYLYKAFVEENE